MVTSKKTYGFAERDREATEQRLLMAVGAMIREEGFEQIGVNAVCARSGVSKILLYRYFGSVEGLMAAYIRQHDFWLNFPRDVPERGQLPAFLKQVFRKQIARLRSDPTLKRLYRWELSSNNELVAALREQRERVGRDWIADVCEKAGLSGAEVAPVASLMTAAVTYLALLEEFCPEFNGIPIQEDAGWEQLVRGIDGVIDRFFRPSGIKVFR